MKGCVSVDFYSKVPKFFTWKLIKETMVSKYISCLLMSSGIKKCQAALFTLKHDIGSCKIHNFFTCGSNGMVLFSLPTYPPTRGFCSKMEHW